MAIINSVDLGPNLMAIEVDADPTTTAVDTTKGSIILFNGVIYRKLDNGSTTNAAKTEFIHIGGNFVDTTNQSIAVADTPQSITFNTNSLIDDMSHIVDSDTFTINTDGVYKMIVAPQLAQGSGSAKVEFWLEKNGTMIVNSGVQEIIGAGSESLPLLRWKDRFVATDTLKVFWASDSTGTMLDNITSSYGGPNIPSIMFGITHIAS